MVLSSAVLPLYETPTAPTVPFDHGCEVIHSVTSPMSATSASDHSTGRWPDRRATAARVNQDQGIAGIVPLVRHLDVRHTLLAHADQQAVYRSHGGRTPVARGDHDRRQFLVVLSSAGTQTSAARRVPSRIVT